MPDPSFDIVSELNPTELDNAITQAQKEIGTRYDFKGTSAGVELDSRAATLFGAATALFETIKVTPPAVSEDSGGYTDCLERLRASLGSAAFEKAWCEGRALSVDAAIRLAVQE